MEEVCEGGRLTSLEAEEEDIIKWNQLIRGKCEVCKRLIEGLSLVISVHWDGEVEEVYNSECLWPWWLKGKELNEIN